MTCKIFLIIDRYYVHFFKIFLEETEQKLTIILYFLSVLFI